MNDDWYKAMASAIARRDRADASIIRWQETKAEAEASINELAAMRPGAVVPSIVDGVTSSSGSITVPAVAQFSEPTE